MSIAYGRPNESVKFRLKRFCHFEPRIRFVRTDITPALLYLFAAHFGAVAEGLAELTVSERAWLKEHPTVRLTPDPDFPPVEFLEQGNFNGITADYVEILQEKLRIRFDIRQVDSWSTSVRQQIFERFTQAD